MKKYIISFLAVFVALLMISTATAMPKNIDKKESTIERILNEDTSLDDMDEFIKELSNSAKSSGVVYSAGLIGFLLSILFSPILIILFLIFDLPPPRFPYP